VNLNPKLNEVIMKIKFLGGARTVTGSCFLIETDDKKILVDCGMFQGGKEMKMKNFRPPTFKPDEIDYIILTHAHIDHSGLIPRIINLGFKGKILATVPTRDLTSIMLPDSGHIQEMEVKWENKKRIRKGLPARKPLYTMEDGENAIKYFETVNYYDEVKLSDNISFIFKYAGHILGSAIVVLKIAEDNNEITITFTGDLGNKISPVLREPELIDSTDYLVIESTYGNRYHDDSENNEKVLKNIINESIKNGGKILIPSFAIDRTQTILYYLNKLSNNNEIPYIPVFIDSPLAIKATKIFSKYYEREIDNFSDFFSKEFLNLVAGGDNPLKFPGLKYTQTVEESKKINEYDKPAIIISASGMCNAGRIKHHLKNHLWKTNTSMVFVGFQAQGTLGKRILEGAKVVDIFGEEVDVRAKKFSIENFSAHADKNDLIEWVANIKNKPENIFIVHGEQAASHSLSNAIEKEFTLNTVVPSINEEYTLSQEKIISLMVPDYLKFEVPQQIIDSFNIKIKQKENEFLKIIDSLNTSLNEWGKEKDAGEIITGLNRVSRYVVKNLLKLNKASIEKILIFYLDFINGNKISDKELIDKINNYFSEMLTKSDIIWNDFIEKFSLFNL
jgi:metallo-beta-lactamase family protein